MLIWHVCHVEMTWHGDVVVRRRGLLNYPDCVTIQVTTFDWFASLASSGLAILIWTRSNWISLSQSDPHATSLSWIRKLGSHASNLVPGASFFLWI